MVRPILEYGVTVWSPYRKGDIDAVESVQRRATLILPELRGLDYEARLRSLKLPTETLFSQRVVDVWNSFPDDVVTAPSQNMLKRRLD